MICLAIDQGTTNTKALLVDESGQILSSASRAMTSTYPHAGWAEQDATQIWASTQAVIAELTREAPAIDVIGIANQRETLVVWDAQTGDPIGPAPLWQCRRTAAQCRDLVDQGHGPDVHSRTGLEINPLFPASKLTWFLNTDARACDLAHSGNLRAGTVDTWLIWNLTGGTVFATDHSNASRTLLFDTNAMSWSIVLADIFGVPRSCLAECKSSDGDFGCTGPGIEGVPAGIPIRAVMGDSHAALYGHGLRNPGAVKATYGTGSSLMMLTEERLLPNSGISSTVAWTEGGRSIYALEGNITVSGQAAEFAAEMLGLDRVTDLAELADTVDDTGGVTFVPALAGLGAPYWDDEARGLFAGLSLGTKRGHIARAAIDAIAQQVADVFEAMSADAGRETAALRADGGASSNSSLMQLQSNLIGCKVERSQVAEVGALGVAAMAANAIGHPMAIDLGTDIFVPVEQPSKRKADRSRWRHAVARARSV